MAIESHDPQTDRSWRRDREGLGVWKDQGKTAFIGWGMSPVDRRWDGVSMDRTLGEFCKVASLAAIKDAGIDISDIDGLFMCPDNMAGANSGPSGSWGPTRPPLAPPYDTEDGISIVSKDWLLANWPELNEKGNIKFAPENVPAIGEGLGYTAQMVADGKCEVALYIYTANNLDGRYRRGGAAALPRATGPGQWNSPWGANIIDLQLNTTFALTQYTQKYNVDWDEMMYPIVANEHRNGLMNDWSFYVQNGASHLTFEDYVNSRPITTPAHIWDYDRPVNAVGAFLIVNAARASRGGFNYKPVYIMNHNQGSGGAARSSSITLDEYEAANAKVARMVYEGSGMKPEDIDIFNPYDGFSSFLPFSLEAFGWHGVEKGGTKDFVNGDISVEGPHPYLSGGGNLGNGRTRTAMYIDAIEQLRGSAGKRQVNVKAETAICAFAPALSAAYLVVANQPS